MNSTDPKYRQVERQLEEEVRGLRPGGKMPTIREMKRKFGVSQSTLDHALQKLEEKRLIVRRRNSGIYADGGIRQRRHSVGVLLQSVSDRFYAHLLRGLERELAEHNYKIILANTPGELAKEIEVIDSLTESVDGLIATPGTANSLDQDYARFLIELRRRRRMPIVFVEVPVPCVASCFVCFNQGRAFRDVTRQIVGGGGTGELWFVGLQESVVTVERFAGFKAALMEAGVDRRRVRLVTADIEMETLDLPWDGKRSGVPPVVFVASPILLPKVLAILQAKGCRLPEDAVVVSVVEEDYKDYIFQPFIAIVKSGTALGALAAKTTLDAIAGKGDTVAARMELRVEAPEALKGMLTNG